MNIRMPVVLFSAANARVIGAWLSKTLRRWRTPDGAEALDRVHG